MGANGTGGDQTSRVINVRASLPPRGEIIKNKLPPIPLKTDVRPAVWRKADMVISTLVVVCGLEAILVDVTREVGKKIQGKGEIFDLWLRNLSRRGTFEV